MFAHELGDAVIWCCWLVAWIWLSIRLTEAFPKFPAWLAFGGTFLVTGFLVSLIV